MIQVTKEQFRNFFVCYHGFDEFFGLDENSAITEIFGRLRSVQFDPLNVVGRNAELVLFSRSNAVTRDGFYNALYSRRELVDGWDKMMCIYSARDFSKFAFVRKSSTEQYRTVMSWRGQDECHAFTEDIYNYIKEHGDTLVTDIPSPKTGNTGWGPSKAAGVCCEYLWNSGRIVVSRKKGVVKAFDITERVLGVDPTENAFDDFDAFMRWYVKRRIAEVGAARNAKGSQWLGAYLENNDLRNSAIAELKERGEIVPVCVDGDKHEYLVCAGDEKYFDFTPASDRAVFLAPLDNMLWDRTAVKIIFDFDYSWEVYTPQAKRKFGYYVLPILIGNRLVGRIEPVLDKKRAELTVKNVWFEPSYTPSADDEKKISDELNRLAKFLDALLLLKKK
ncbi:MAG: winged helix-turn-helix domain-containing protein [Clostridiales bacterium]|nr:winged helix-turn-helix domain-containing protein [Clostridiales bacterium]